MSPPCAPSQAIPNHKHCRRIGAFVAFLCADALGLGLRHAEVKKHHLHPRRLFARVPDGVNPVGRLGDLAERVEVIDAHQAPIGRHLAAIGDYGEDVALALPGLLAFKLFRLLDAPC